MPGAMHSGFAQFAAFDQDAIDNRASPRANGKLKMPVLALGGEKSFGLTMAVVMRAGADNVTEGVDPRSGHWIMEENPDATVTAGPRLPGPRASDPAPPARRGPAAALRRERNRGGRPAPPRPRRHRCAPALDAGAGTSGVAGIRTRILSGDPTKPGLYTIALTVPANTRIAAHRHRDDRTATVVSGTRYFGYGAKADDTALQAAPARQLLCRAGRRRPFRPHRRRRRCTLYITGIGPTDTRYVELAAHPERFGRFSTSIFRSPR